MRTGKRRSATVIISRGLPGILRSLFVLIDDRTAAQSYPVTWVCASARLSSTHVWSRSPLLRRQRDQTRLLDPTASADAEHRAELERGADRPAPDRPLRRKGRRAQLGYNALGPRAVRGEGHQSRFLQHQREGRG